MGRVDDVMNVSGHRISTIEVESALVDHPSVAEAAVCGRADATTGQAIVAFVSLHGGEEGSLEMLDELRDHVAQKIGKIARPANIVFTPELPKTRSGKIMRRLLRDVSENRALGDTTTLADPTVVNELQTPRRDRALRGGLALPRRAAPSSSLSHRPLRLRVASRTPGTGSRRPACRTNSPQARHSRLAPRVSAKSSCSSVRLSATTLTVRPS